MSSIFLRNFLTLMPIIKCRKKTLSSKKKKKKRNSRAMQSTDYKRGSYNLCLVGTIKSFNYLQIYHTTLI